jgi:hydrogenase maturation protein HypF
MEGDRYRIVLGGAVQGVGLRPFVYRLATSLNLAGYVQNSSDGLVIEVEGAPDRLDRFTDRLRDERPAAALVTEQQVTRLAPVGGIGFLILDSNAAQRPRAGLLNDLATCSDCLRELTDPANRRYGYVFTNCTACGPRFTIVEQLPYDRGSTTMRRFEMCDACRAEYQTPIDRRYHAQPNACPRCGPTLSHSIDDIARALRAGSIVALKGIGGFHLLCDARNGDAVSRLRRRKARDFKPFAVMMPSLVVTRDYCMVSDLEAAALTSAAAPILLLQPRLPSDLARGVSADAPFVGVMLPYSPLHHLLMREHGLPIVATSGNVAGEPIAIDDEQARTRLGSIADLIVTHDRPIARPCDDSVARVGAHGLTILRRARGFAPLPIDLGVELPTALAVGGHLKSTIALGVGRHAVVSQHLGDLDTTGARRGFEAAIDDLCSTYGVTPAFVVADRHPDYASHRWAELSGFRVVEIQHHHAHVAACAAENGVRGPYLGVAWDGAGLGDDGTIWGGEFFAVDGSRFERVTHLRPFRLPGGDAAAREGWRVVAAMDWITRGDIALEGREHAGVLAGMLARGVNAPWSTSAGRLFDAVAAIVGVRECSRFEGEAALALEAAIDVHESGTYPFGSGVDGDWAPMLDAIRSDLDQGERQGAIAARFHRTLVDWIRRVAGGMGIRSVVLSGGVFQNAFLVDRAVEALTAGGHAVYTHRRVPANDGGLSLGQLALAQQLANGD